MRGRKAALSSLLSALGYRKVDLVGHSLGGTVAFVLADALTEKFGGDSVEELQANWKAFRDRTTARFARS